MPVDQVPQPTGSSQRSRERPVSSTGTETWTRAAAPPTSAAVWKSPSRTWGPRHLNSGRPRGRAPRLSWGEPPDQWVLGNGRGHTATQALRAGDDASDERIEAVYGDDFGHQAGQERGQTSGHRPRPRSADAQRPGPSAQQRFENRAHSPPPQRPCAGSSSSGLGVPQQLCHGGAHGGSSWSPTPGGAPPDHGPLELTALAPRPWTQRREARGAPLLRRPLHREAAEVLGVSRATATAFARAWLFKG